MRDVAASAAVGGVVSAVGAIPVLALAGQPHPLHHIWFDVGLGGVAVGLLLAVVPYAWSVLADRLNRRSDTTANAVPNPPLLAHDGLRIHHNIVRGNGGTGRPSGGHGIHVIGPNAQGEISDNIVVNPAGDGIRVDFGTTGTRCRTCSTRVGVDESRCPGCGADLTAD